MDIFIGLGILGLIFIQLLAKHRGSLSRASYGLSKDNTNALRGILAVCIVLHHIASNYSHEGLFLVFRFFGTEITAIYFFLSGYGLMLQHQNRPDYHKHFLRDKFGRLFFEYFCINLLYLAYFLLTESRSLLQILKDAAGDMRFGFPFVPYSWFILAILIFYLFFDLAFGRIRKTSLSCLLFGVLMLCYFAFVYRFFSFTQWYASILAFPLGLLWANHKNRIDAFWNGLRIESFFALLLVCGIFALLTSEDFPLLSAVSLPTAPRIGMLLIHNGLSAVFFILLLYRFTACSKLTGFLGKISLEIYLLQGLAVYIANRLFAGRGLIHACSVLALTGLFAVSWHSGKAFIKYILAAKSAK